MCAADFILRNTSSQTEHRKSDTTVKQEREALLLLLRICLSALGYCGLDLVHDGRFRQRTQIAQLITFACNNLAHYTAHNLARARLGKVVDDVDLLRCREGADNFANLLHEFLVETRLIVIFELPVRRNGKSLAIRWVPSKWTGHTV